MHLSAVPFFSRWHDLELFADRENGLGLCVINGETQRRHSQASVGDSEVAYAENLLPPLADQPRSSKWAFTEDLTVFLTLFPSSTDSHTKPKPLWDSLSCFRAANWHQPATFLVKQGSSQHKVTGDQAAGGETFSCNSMYPLQPKQL